MDHRIFQKIFILFFLSFFLCLSAHAQTEVGIQDIQAHNPDGKKYEFVRDYVSSLKYLEQNTQRMASNAKDLSDTPDGLQTQINLLVNDNVNLRVARNIMNNYIHEKNDLMVKIADEFKHVCDEQVEFNNQERSLLKKLYAVGSGDTDTAYSKDQFVADLEKVSQARKASLKALLKSSVLVSRLVVSDKKDNKGEFSYLGITENQRKDLIAQLDEFKGEGFDGELRAGQSFLQGSVAIIREKITDSSREGLQGGIY